MRSEGCVCGWSGGQGAGTCCGLLDDQGLLLCVFVSVCLCMRISVMVYICVEGMGKKLAHATICYMCLSDLPLAILFETRVLHETPPDRYSAIPRQTN